jgi:predicted amidohydrolase YtcJ
VNATGAFRIEHAQHLKRRTLPGLPATVIASMQPYHAIDDGRWAEKRIGPQRAQTTYAFRSLLDADVTLAFGNRLDSRAAKSNAVNLCGRDPAHTRRQAAGWLGSRAKDFR